MVASIVIVVISYVVSRILVKLKNLRNLEGILFYTLVITIVLHVIWCTVSAIVLPVKDWAMTEEIRITSLKNEMIGTGRGFIYVKISPDNIYQYRVEIKSGVESSTSKSYELKYLSGNQHRIVEEEDPNCTQAYLRVYTKCKEDSKIFFWGGYCVDEMYVFYVPEGTIKKELNLD